MEPLRLRRSFRRLVHGVSSFYYRNLTFRVDICKMKGMFYEVKKVCQRRKVHQRVWLSTRITVQYFVPLLIFGVRSLDLTERCLSYLMRFELS